MSQNRLLRLAVVAGEASGDILGAELIHSLRERYPNIEVEGVAGPKMIAAGCHALYPMDSLAVMGIVDPLKRLPTLLRIRKNLISRFTREKRPDVVIGIDSPDFNLTLELKCKQAGIPTVHYVSPSVWAWRKGRIHKIKRAVDLILTLLPFEAGFYLEYDVPVKYVGHPLADIIPVEVEKQAARDTLNLPENKKILGLLPGSRKMEVQHLAPTFFRTAMWCHEHLSELQIIAVMPNEERKKQMEKILKKTSPQLPVRIFVGNSHDVMAASDALLIASGTATLEAMLLKCPMVVAYRVSFINYWVARLLIEVDYFALPNLIAGRRLVPEFFQEEAVPEVMAPILLEQLTNEEKLKRFVSQCTRLHYTLKQNASDQAAESVLRLLKRE